MWSGRGWLGRGDCGKARSDAGSLNTRKAAVQVAFSGLQVDENPQSRWLKVGEPAGNFG